MGIVSILVAFLIFSVIVVVHEFGHFLFAKRAGILVEEFAIGMGPVLFSKKFSETLFSIRALPIGGFCRMYGEDMAVKKDDRAYSAKSLFSRFKVIAGGPLFNFILAFIVAFILLAQLGGTLTTQVASFSDVSPIREAGVQEGDIIVGYNDKAVFTFRELVIYINTDLTETVDIEVKREGVGRLNYTMVPAVDEDGRYFVGFIASAKEFDNVFEVVEYAARELAFNVRIIVYQLGHIAKYGFNKDEVAGPIGIVSTIGKDVTESATVGGNAAWLTVLSWTVLLSANLGVMNLLPIPALDGGRIIFLLVELIRGKPLDPNKEGFVHFLGFVLLMGLMVLLFYNDIVRLFV